MRRLVLYEAGGQKLPPHSSANHSLSGVNLFDLNHRNLCPNNAWPRSDILAAVAGLGRRACAAYRPCHSCQVLEMPNSGGGKVETAGAYFMPILVAYGYHDGNVQYLVFTPGY